MRDKNEPIFNTKYILDVQSKIKNKNVKSAISQELYSHILDKRDYYIELGYDEKTAMKRATEDMGEAEDTATQLNGIHSEKWCKQPVNIFILLFLIAQLVLLHIFTNNIDFYERGNNIYKFSRDIVSSVVLIVNAFVIWLGVKKRNKFIIGSEIGFWFLCSHCCTAFLYRHSILVSFGQGLNEFISGIVVGDFVNGKTVDYLNSGSVTLRLCMISYCIYALWLIHRHETGRSGKHHYRTHKIATKITAVCLSSNMILLCCYGVIAYSNRDKIIEKNKEVRGLAVEYVLETDMLAVDTYGQLKDNLEYTVRAIDKHYSYEYLDGVDFFYMDNVALGVVDTGVMFGNERGCSLMYMCSSVTKSKDVEEYMLCDKSEFDSLQEGMTVKEFLRTGLQEKVIMAQKDDYIGQPVELTFKTTDNDSITVSFEYNKLTYVNSYNEYLAESQRYSQEVEEDEVNQDIYEDIWNEFEDGYIIENDTVEVEREVIYGY